MSPADRRKAFTQYGYYTAMVTQMAMSMVGGVILGNWLDGKFDIFPILTSLGTFLGMVVGLKNLIQMVNYFKEKDSGKGRPNADGEE